MEKKIVIYDFDGTITPYPMPKFEILKKIGIENYAKDINFRNIVKQRMVENNIDFYTAIYELLFETIKNTGYKLTDETFCMGVENIEYNKGISEFLAYLNYNNVDNYVVSSGIKIYIKKTNVGKYFKEIYATEFEYNANKEITGIKFLMDDKSKVDKIKEIIAKNNLKDCSNIIYIGDGLTDSYAFEYVHKNGGKAIYVYLNQNDENISVIKEKGIVDMFFLADYCLYNELAKYILNEFQIK